ncbi:DNA methyltransferase [Citrobacter werkmanii]|uniref:Eco57I restriction-modification methylase domain-containing protein n=1 Tax=Citrobacter werkmanii TaxID=67827 RepID=UPI0028855FA1|nr:DNA methyltransferase [Citrobacter werkmanii]MDT0639893.1 DNA methyltransferase [Citrobacter werkmanii]
MSLNNIHAEWLSLVDISGPFLAIPVLTHTFPQGLEVLSSFKRRRLRQAYDEWREALELEDPQLEELHSAWIDEVLSRVLEFDDDGKGDVLKREEWCRSHLKSVLPDQGVVEYPDLAVVDEQQDNKPLLLIHTYKPNVELESTVKHEGWITTPADRMVQLCRSLGCRLGLLTNGECWMLVDAPVGAVTSFSSWYARLWSQEPITLQAFVHLLGIRRFFVDESEQLPALFDASLKYQDEVTDALGEQVCRAVEVLIQSLDKADQDRNRELLHDVNETELYEAALAVMMRLVFLLSAEEQGLLLLGDECYESNYAISTLRMQLRQEPSELLERRWDAWTRLLSTFRAVYGGVEHEDLRLPALGSSLFDPDHFPFLEGRTKGSNWKIDTAVPLPINNRTVLLLLESIQLFQGRTLSYRALDVEQIGYVYEGLLERTVKRAAEVTLELNATKKAQSPWVTLAELDSVSMDGTEQLIELLHERSGSSISKIRNELSKLIDDSLIERLLITCQGDTKLRDRIKPYVHLLRTDPWGYPLVYPAGSFIVTSGSNRRETGTHYTPKSLTEAIVAETLTPLTYIGPTEGIPREKWQLKSSSELLTLKICDPAMGSGAFLVQTCRWLADRLVESWILAEESGKKISVDGYILVSSSTQESLPHDTDARIVIARRLIAERCLYGVDLNPLAVELAKLSIWLVTLAKDRPFGFLEHNLRCGDSLLGIERIDQLTQFSMNSTAQGQKHLFSEEIERAVDEAVLLRQQLREMTIRDIHDVESMGELNSLAEVRLKITRCIADAYIGEVLIAQGNDMALEKALAHLSIQVRDVIQGNTEQLELIQRRALTALSFELPVGKASRRPFHWPLEFPEVFSLGGGFDCIVGNPPFLGGQKITGTMGDCYREYLVNTIACGKRGSADLVAYFFIKANALLCSNGFFGLIAVNTISEGNTREIGLDLILRCGSVIFRAYPNLVWPGKANVVTSSVFVSKSNWNAPFYISGQQVSVISAALTQRENWQPVKLEESCSFVFQGVITLGEGFLVDNKTYLGWVEKGDNSCEVVFDYLIGKEVNQSPTHTPNRKIINFFDLDEHKASKYSSAFDIVEQFVKPERQRLKNGKYALRSPLPQRWWQYAEKRPALFHAVGRGSNFVNHPKGWKGDFKSLERVIVFATGATKYPCFTFIPNTYICGHSLCIIASESYALFTCLSSDIHAVWAWEHGSRMKQDLRYTHGDIFETFPFPENTLNNGDKSLSNLGVQFFEARACYMIEQNKGMTKFYNDLHNPNINTNKINELRDLQTKINNEVLRAYGFDELDLEQDFHEVAYLPEGKNVRFTISEPAREELLCRLATLNKNRYEGEQNND